MGIESIVKKVEQFNIQMALEYGHPYDDTFEIWVLAATRKGQFYWRLSLLILFYISMSAFFAVLLIPLFLAGLGKIAFDEIKERIELRRIRNV